MLQNKHYCFQRVHLLLAAIWTPFIFVRILSNSPQMLRWFSLERNTMLYTSTCLKNNNNNNTNNNNNNNNKKNLHSSRMKSSHGGVKVVECEKKQAVFRVNICILQLSKSLVFLDPHSRTSMFTSVTNIGSTAGYKLGYYFIITCQWNVARNSISRRHCFPA